MPIWGWANLLVPLFHCFHGFHGVYWQRDQYWTSSYYPGVAIVALAVLAGLLIRKRNVQVLSFIALLALLLALGDAGILYGWLRHAIPQFGFMRFPVKFLVLLSFALPLLEAYAVSHLQTSAPASDPSHEGNLAMLSAGHLNLRRRPWAMVRIVWMLFWGIMLAVVWYARLHPARDENWTLTWKNGLGRAFLLTLTLGALYLYNQLSAQPTPRRRGTPPISPPSGSTPVDGPRVGTGSKSPTPVRGLLPEQRGSVLAGLALTLCLVLDLLTHVPDQNPVISRQVFEPGLMQLSPQPRHGDGR